MTTPNPLLTWLQSSQGRWAAVGVAVLVTGLALSRRTRPAPYRVTPPAQHASPAQQGDPAQRAPNDAPRMNLHPNTNLPGHPSAPPPDAPPEDRPGPSAIREDLPSAPFTAAERAIFAPVAEGSTVGPATVASFEGLRDGFLRVHTTLAEPSDAGARDVTVVVAKLAGSNARPPVTAGPYALYYMAPSVPYPTVELVLRAVGAALAARDGGALPPGLGPMVVPDPTH